MMLYDAIEIMNSTPTLLWSPEATSRVVAFTSNSYVKIIQCANVSSSDRFFSYVFSSHVR